MSVDRSHQVSPPPSTGTPPLPAVIVCTSLRQIELLKDRLKDRLPPYKPVDGAVLVPCPLCADQMWLGPLSREKRDKEGIPVICELCCIKGWTGPPIIIDIEKLKGIAQAEEKADDDGDEDDTVLEAQS